MGYGQGQMGRMPQPMQYPPQALWRPGLPPPPAAGYMQAAGYAHPMVQSGRYVQGLGGHAPAPRLPATSSTARGPPGRREMDSLLEELKAKQEQRKEALTEKKEGEASPQGDMGVPSVNLSFPNVPLATLPMAGDIVRPAVAVSTSMGTSGGSSWGAGGASAAADELASLLFLRELPPSATEDAICALFSRYGTVTAVDIVQSKDDGRIQGYVSIDSRENAQRAKDALQDREMDGVPLWIEWSKSPSQGAHVEHSPQSKERKSRVVIVEIPADAKKRRTIDRLARYVAQEGFNFEKLIMQRESPEGIFDFLFHHDSPENIYYRWRMFAFTQRDNFKVWRTQTFRIYEGGRWWRPPPCEAALEAAEKKRQSKFSSSGGEDLSLQTPPPQVPNPATAVKAARGNAVLPAHWTQEDIEEERERQRLEERATQERQKRDRSRTVAGSKRLSDEDWSQLEQLLRNVSRTRASIMETMVFCLDKSEWAVEIAETITESLTIAETEIPLKVARLLVVSDILHNTTSSRPAAWTYRREFEKALPDIFEQFEIGLQRSESKLQVSQAKDQIVRLLKVWEDWGLFAPQYLRGLEAAVMIGVRRLRLLSSKGDLSREPAWLEPKLADWRRQHFSQLEKMCRTRGLRCSTAHLEATKQLSLEEARKEWLIDRLVSYELLAHEKEQAKLQQAKEEAANKLSRRKSKYAMEDIDGEDCGDGFPMDDNELDGEPIELSTPGEIYNAVEMAKQAPEAASYLGTVGPGAVLGAVMNPSPAASAAEEVVSVISMEETTTDEEMLDIRPSSTSEKEEVPIAEGKSGAEVSERSPQSLLRDIELEVMELRASLELKGLHRDAIQDACKKKKKEMIEEHEGKQDDGKKDILHPISDTDVKEKEKKDRSLDKDLKEKSQKDKDVQREKERTQKEKDVTKEKDKDKDKIDKDPAKEKEREKEKEKEKEREKEKKKQEEAKMKEAKEKEKQREKDKDKERQERDKERLKKEKEKEGDRDKEKERDREREKGKEKVRPKDSEKEGKEKDIPKAREKDKEDTRNPKEKAKLVKRRSPPSKSPPNAKKKVRR